jgi:predicted enzyme related to lactoylglutathione lyase
MTIPTRYAHTNIIARDWKRLAQFYQRVFGCVVVQPRRNLWGRWLEEATGVPKAHIRGVHLLLPGYGKEGPTLEIFQYDEVLKRPETVANSQGFSHLAFAVEDVAAAQERVQKAGGGNVGKRVTRVVRGVGTLTFAYIRDPEGNIIELQRWSTVK